MIHYAVLGIVLFASCLPPASGAVDVGKGSIVFFSDIGLHVVNMDGTGFRTILSHPRPFSISVPFPPATAGLCVDHVMGIVVWTENTVNPITHKMFAVSLQGGPKYELLDAKDQYYLGCALDPATSTGFIVIHYPNDLGSKVHSFTYSGPSPITLITKPSVKDAGIRVSESYGGGITLLGGKRWVTLVESGYNPVLVSDEGTAALTKHPASNTFAWQTPGQIGHVCASPDGKLYLLWASDPSSSVRSTTILTTTPSSPTISVAWAEPTMIPAPVSQGGIGTMEPSFACVGDVPDTLLYVGPSSWVPGNIPGALPIALFATSLSDPTKFKEIYSPPGGDTDPMVSVVGLGPVAWLSNELPPVMPPVVPPATPPVLPPIMPPVLPPVMPPVFPPVMPPVTPTCPDYKTQRDCAAGQCMWTPQGCVTPPPPTPIPTIETKCSMLNNPTTCATFMAGCVWDALASACIVVDCAGRKDKVSCEAVADCLWKGGQCSLSIDCTAKGTEADCDQQQGCKWDGVISACRGVGYAAAEQADSEAGDKLLLIVLASAGGVFLLALCLAVVVFFLRRRLVQKEVDDDTEDLSRELQETASPKATEGQLILKRANNALHDIFYNPPAISRSALYGSEDKSPKGADSSSASMVVMPEPGRGLSRGGQRPSLAHLDEHRAESAANIESEREKELKRKLAAAQSNLKTARKEFLAHEGQEAARRSESEAEEGQRALEKEAKREAEREAKVERINTLWEKLTSPPEVKVVPPTEVPEVELESVPKPTSTISRRPGRHQSFVLAEDVQTIACSMPEL